MLYRVGTHQIRRRRGAARSSTSQGRAEPLCAKIKGANREVSERKLMSDHGRSSCFSYEGHKEGAWARFVGLFRGCIIGLWTAGWMLARAPASPAQALYHHVFVCFLPIHFRHQVRWTYQPGSHRRKVTQDFSSTFFLRCVPYFFSREGFSHSFLSSTVKSNLEFVF